MFLADFHIHSKFSDGRLFLPEVIDFYGKRGFGAIAITDHLCEVNHWLGLSARWLGKSLSPKTFPYYIEAIEKEKERAWKEYRLLVIPGVEITKNSTNHQDSAHVLLLGLRDWISPDQSIEDLLVEARERGALSIAAHPVSTRKYEHQTFYLWNNREKLKDLFDAWEVASGPFIFEEVRKSGFTLVANSDLHHPRQINSWKNRMDCEKTESAVFEAIREQDLDFVFYKDPVTAPGPTAPLRLGFPVR